MLSIPISVGPQSNLVRDWAQTGDQLLLLYLSAKNNRFICLFIQHIFVEHLLLSTYRVPGTGNIAVNKVLSISLCRGSPGCTSFSGTFSTLVAEMSRVLKGIHWLCCPQSLAYVDFGFKKHKWLYINSTLKGSFLFRFCLGLLENPPLKQVKIKIRDNPSHIFIFRWVNNLTWQ